MRASKILFFGKVTDRADSSGQVWCLVTFSLWEFVLCVKTAPRGCIKNSEYNHFGEDQLAFPNYSSLRQKGNLISSIGKGQ